MIKVLFICHGNICRSPMAEFILKDLLATTSGLDNYIIESAATSSEEIWNGTGNPVYPPARQELALHGIDPGDKRAVQVRQTDYEKYDYLICMDDNNIRNLKRIVGGDRDNKISLLLDFARRQGQSVADPWYTGDFKKTYSDIYEGCLGIVERLEGKD